MILAKLGDVEFSLVSNERPEYSNEVTDRPVEDIGSISDHVSNKPISFSIEGIVTGEDASQRISLLRQYARQKTLLKYVGRNVLSNMVIEILSTEHNSRIRNGFIFTIQLKQIKIATSKTMQIQLPDPVNPKPIGAPATTTQTKPVSEAGTQQPDKVAMDIERWQARYQHYLADQRKLKKAQEVAEAANRGVFMT